MRRTWPTMSTSNIVEVRSLLFAIASELLCAFPARQPTVVAVHPIDSSGNCSELSPTATAFELKLMMAGERIDYSWLLLCGDDEPALPKGQVGQVARDTN